MWIMCVYLLPTISELSETTVKYVDSRIAADISISCAKINKQDFKHIYSKLSCRRPQRGRKRCLQIYLLPCVTLNFDLLTPRLFVLCPCPVDHL